MNRRFGVIAALVFVGVLGCVMPALAQDQEAQIDFVAHAFENMRALDSLTADIQLTSQTAVSAPGVLTTKTLAQQISSKVMFDDTNTQVDMTIRQTDSQERTEALAIPSDPETASRTVDIIAIGSRIYIRIRDAVPQLPTPPPSNEWLEVDRDTVVFSTLGSNSAQQYLALITAGFEYPLTNGVVASIGESDADEIDGQAMRVFDISYDWQHLRLTNPDQFALLTFLGWDLTDQKERAFGMKVWIGANDELIYRIDVTASTETELERDPNDADDNVHITTTDTMSFRYAQFNQSFEIEAPPPDSRCQMGLGIENVCP